MDPLASHASPHPLHHHHHHQRSQVILDHSSIGRKARLLDAVLERLPCRINVLSMSLRPGWTLTDEQVPGKAKVLLSFPGFDFSSLLIGEPEDALDPCPESHLFPHPDHPLTLDNLRQYAAVLNGVDIQDAHGKCEKVIFTFSSRVVSWLPQLCCTPSSFKARS